MNTDKKILMARVNRDAAYLRLNPFVKLAADPVKFGRILASRVCHILKIKKEVTAKTFWGDSMRVVLPDGVSAAIFSYGCYETDLTLAILGILREKDVFFDVGAHYGYYTLLAAVIVGNSGQVHTFEPTPHTFKVLSKNVAGKNNIFINQKAVSDSNGSTSFFDFGSLYPAGNSFIIASSEENSKNTPPHQKITVETIALDSYCREKNIKPTFIKLDAEHSELQALRGAVKILSDFKPALSVETWGYNDHRDYYFSVISFLKEHDYRPYSFQDGKLQMFENESQLAFTNLLCFHKDDPRQNFLAQ